MKKIIAAFVIMLFTAALSASAFGQVASIPATKTGAAQQAAPQAAPIAPEGPIYDEKADAKADIAAALARAAKENRRVLIQWGGNWCGWCRLLHKLFNENQAIAKVLLYEYDVVMVDIGNFNKNLDVADRYNKAYTEGFKSAGVPYLTVLDGAGNVVANQDTNSLEAGQGHDPKKVVDFLVKNKAAYLDASVLLAKGLAEAKASGRRVFMHFGAPWCGWCKKLEAWMAQPEIAALLKKDFVDLKIDQDRTNGGLVMKRDYPGAEKSGIPWFAALDLDGKVVATSTDSGANTGFPANAGEIAAFGGFLEKSAKRLTAADIQTLLASLTAAGK
ncbi:MAG: thioredoxin family protein [Candidatus Aminicenantes bacterium]|nr:thioredoxin family protein [Candidatus Aminicenantes bacterium]